jgi:hypothetical protein
VLTSDGRGGQAGRGDAGGVLTRARAAMERRRDEGEERQRLELGVRELGREGKRGGEGRGCSSPFIGGEGALGRGDWGCNGWC